MSPDFSIERFSLDPMFGPEMENMRKIFELLSITGQNYCQTRSPNTMILLIDPYLTNTPWGKDLETQPDWESELLWFWWNKSLHQRKIIPIAPRQSLVASVCSASGGSCFKTFLAVRARFNDWLVPQDEFSSLVSCVLWSTDFHFWLRPSLLSIKDNVYSAGKCAEFGQKITGCLYWIWFSDAFL